MKNVALLAFLLAALALAAGSIIATRLGKQADGTFLVATGQRIPAGTIAFDGRPIDIALRPGGAMCAVLNQKEVFLVSNSSVLEESRVKLPSGCSFHGIVWSPDGTRLYASLSSGQVQKLRVNGNKLEPDGLIQLAAPGSKRNPVPGGMAITQDGKRLFVACANLSTVLEVDLGTGSTKELPVQQIPFEVKLTADDRTLVVSNWGGRKPGPKEEQADSDDVPVSVDERGVARSGTISIVDLASRRRQDVAVGIRPSGMTIKGGSVFVANGGSDTISEVDLRTATVRRTLSVRWNGKQLYGSMPTDLASSDNYLYSCNAGDNAVARIDLRTGKTDGFLPAGFFPVGIALAPNGKQAWVVNSKGNGSVRLTLQGKAGNAHNFQGTVSVIDLGQNIKASTALVAANNSWNPAPIPNLAIYGGKIKHVLYIIKENRTYDEVFGDMPQGDGDPSLAGLNRAVTPNHHALAEEFTLFDNAYVSGTNSAEGHQWAMEGLANDYIERFYGGYSRSYPYDGGDPMAYSNGGFLWDAAIKKNKSIRIYGEFATESKIKITPMPKSWMEAWEDRKNGTGKIKVSAGTTVASLRPYLHPRVINWPLLLSDQWRADEFISEYQQFSRADKVPNLMVLTLPSDHTAGTSPAYPTPRSMVADNDLALGRVVEAVSKSPQWRDTAIFVMEDDAQAGPDHVDGHRTVCLVISPYTKRGFVDSTLYTQISVVRSIRLMLGLDPMAKFDAVAQPFAACFTNTPDLRPYTARPNTTPIGEMNPKLESLQGDKLFWAKKSLSLDWSGVDTADWYWLNRIVWHSLHGSNVAYPDGY